MGDKPKLLILTGTTRGIGHAIARGFLASGWRVEGCYHQDEIAARSTENEFEPFGGRFRLSRCDVTEEMSVVSWIGDVIRRSGPPDAVIHNAGFTRDQVLLKTSEEDWDDVLSVHLGGAKNLTRAVLPVLMCSGGGHLMFVSSIAATSGALGQAAYVSAKAAEVGFARSLAREYGSRNIRCNVILPGFHDTKLTEPMSPEARQALLSRHLLSQPPTLEETASFFLWLVSSRGISGQVFNLDSRIPGWL